MEAEVNSEMAYGIEFITWGPRGPAEPCDPVGPG